MGDTATSGPASAPAVGVDVGGTKILAGLVAPDGRIAELDRRPTPPDPDDLVDAICDAAAGMQPDRGTPIGIGFPGLVTREGVTRYGPNVSLREHPLRATVAARLGGATVVLENDANAATWAEFAVGAGRAVRETMIMYTLGTGVGGGLVIGRRLHRGANGFAGELGHTVLRIGGAPGPSGIDGELEAYSSGTGIAMLAAQAHAEGRLAGSALDGEVAPTGESVTAAAQGGDAAARAILAEAGTYLGVAAAGLVNALDPELIVVGGGAAAAGDLVLDPARAALADHVLGARHRPPVPIVPAVLGSDAGMVGAALLARDAAAG